jgi:hypothetical protein
MGVNADDILISYLIGISKFTEKRNLQSQDKNHLSNKL